MRDSVCRRTHHHTVGGCGRRRWWRLDIVAAASAATASGKEQCREEHEAEQHGQSSLAIPQSSHQDRRKHESARGTQPSKAVAPIRVRIRVRMRIHRQRDSLRRNRDCQRCCCRPAHRYVRRIEATRDLAGGRRASQGHGAAEFILRCKVDGHGCRTTGRHRDLVELRGQDEIGNHAPAHHSDLHGRADRSLVGGISSINHNELIQTKVKVIVKVRY